MLAGVLLQQRGRRGARAAASWALGDDGPLYCLARRGGVGAGAAGLDAFVACPAASSGTHVAWHKRWRAQAPRLAVQASAFMPLAAKSARGDIVSCLSLFFG